MNAFLQIQHTASCQKVFSLKYVSQYRSKKNLNSKRRGFWKCLSCLNIW